ncbi:tol-pal system YbgF family protein [Bacteroides sp. 519]|uniref:tetratricopeptide repeat protein n=1 Tax=Bacteroides sp. 519 TaxID=2302937 RepID=UPI0013D2E6FE|nr:hypothetical protein [Bacteroides sp. 519]
MRQLFYLTFLLIVSSCQFAKKDTTHSLARAYLQSGTMYLQSGDYNPKGVNNLLMGIEVCDKNDYDLLGELHYALGTFSSFHLEKEKSLAYYNEAIGYFKKAGNTERAGTVLLEGKALACLMLNDLEETEHCFREVTNLPYDSTLIGSALEETAIFLGLKAEYDSTMYYLRKSANYPVPQKNSYKQSYSIVDCYYFLPPEVQLLLMNFPQEMHQYLSSTDIYESDYNLLGKLYSAFGTLSIHQQNIENSLMYYRQAAYYYSRTANTNGIARVNSKMGSVYMAKGDYQNSEQSYRKIIGTLCDSIFIGDALENISFIFWLQEKNDSVLHYLHASLEYPVLAHDRRLLKIADVYHEMEEYDLAKVYYNRMIEEFGNDIYTVVECLQKLKDIELEAGNNEVALQYMERHNLLLDSINTMSKQSDIDDVRRLYYLGQEHQKVKMQRLFIVVSAVLILVFLCFLVHWFMQKNKQQKLHAEKYKKTLEVTKEENKQQKQELIEKQYQQLEELKEQLAQTRLNYQDKWKAANFQQREELTKRIYNEVLLFESEDRFISKMNKTLNNIPAKLKAQYPEISFNDILWCCLFLLDIQTNDICLIMNYKVTSLYKYKQRLYKKLGFNSAKELEEFLKKEYEVLG